MNFNGNSTMKERMYFFLTNNHHFQNETLDLLEYKNLKKLAVDYGFNKLK